MRKSVNIRKHLAKPDFNQSALYDLALNSAAFLKYMTSHPLESVVLFLLFFNPATPVFAETSNRRISAQNPASLFYDQSMGICHQADVPVCDTVMPLNLGHIEYKCGEHAIAAYSNNKDRYFEDVGHVQTIFQQLTTEQPIVKCKMQEIVESDSRFHIQLDNPEDFEAQSIRAYYEEKFLRMHLKSGIVNNLSNRRLMQHEIHHAYIANRNYQKRVNFFPEFNVSNGDPFQHLGEDKEPTSLNRFNEAINKGMKNILNLAMIIEKQPKQLTAKEKLLLKQYQAAAKNYVPHEFRSSTSDITYLNHFVNNGVFTFIETHPFLNVKFNIQKRVHDVVQEGENYFVLKMSCVADSKNKINVVPLYDAVVYIANVLTGGVRGDKEKELDAYIHELFEPYSELFDFLFPDLRAFHAKEATESYKACLKQ